MSWLSKVIKKVKKPLLGAARVALSGATGGLSEKVMSIGKAVGKLKKVSKASKALDAMPRLQLAESKYYVPAPTEGVGVQATAMPGGSSLRKAPKRRRKTTAKAKKPKAAPKKKASGSKRKPPSGGLNLKALSASWKAAGKPGTWQQWIKANK